MRSPRDPLHGWLRWAVTEYDAAEWEPDACATHHFPIRCAPPLRRLGMFLWDWVTLPRLAWRARRENFGLSWEELRPYWPSDLEAPPDASPWSTYRRVG